MTSGASLPLSKHGFRDYGRDVRFAIIFVVVVLTGLMYPVLAVTAVVTLIATVGRSTVVAAVAAVVLWAGILAWMNSGKGVSGDWEWYTEHYRMLAWLDLGDYLGHVIAPFTIKITEPTYYTLSFVVSRLSGADIAVLAVLITLLIYVSVGTAVTLFVTRLTASPYVTYVAVTAALLCGVTFTLTTQLVRQEVALALAMLGFLALATGRKWPGASVLTLALLSHNSVLVPVAAVAAVSFACRWKGGRNFVALSSLLTFAFLSLGYLYSSSDFSSGYEGVSNGSVSYLVVILDLTLLITFVFLARSMTSAGHLPRIIPVSLVVFSAFILGVASDPIPLLRMYFYVEGFRTMMLAAVIAVLLRSRQRAELSAMILILAVVYFEIRVASSPFSYEGGLLQHLTVVPFSN